MMSASNRRIEHLRRMTRRPTPPGQVVAGLLEESGITQGEAAERLGVGRQTVNELLRSKRILTPDMAHRLGRLFGNGPQLWLNMQQNLEMWDALHMDVSSYEGIKTLQTDEDLSEEISEHNLVNVN